MPSTGESRRSFLGLLTQAVMAVIALCLAAPAVAYVCSPLWKRKGTDGADAALSDAGPLADVPIGPWQAVTVEVVRRDGWETSRTRRAVWVRRTGPGEHNVAILSPICPHLGCPINWLPDRAEFVCPCHKGTFDAEGHLVSGPPPRGLDALEFEVRGGRLYVRWQDFKIGVAQQSPVDV